MFLGHFGVAFAYWVDRERRAVPLAVA